MEFDLLVLFEDPEWKNLWPLSAARPVYDLRVGAFRMWEKQRRALKANNWAVSAGLGRGREACTTAFAKRNGVAEVPGEVKARGEVLWWNGAAFPPAQSLPALVGETAGLRLRNDGGRVVALRHKFNAVSAAEAHRLLDGDTVLPPGWSEEQIEVVCLSALWDLPLLLGTELERDLDQRLHDVARSPRLNGVHIQGEHFSTAHGVEIAPGAVIDARPGPVFLHEDVRVEAHTHLVGPAYIGPRSELLGGRITSVAMGPECRVGGEVDTVIFQGFANKRHQGFLGHAAVGEWTNLGALTTNSDLKNNYGPVRVWQDGQEVDSGEAKVGCFLGDHVKTGIGTLITTGCVVGPGSNLFGGGVFTPRFLPGWSWWDGSTTRCHQWDKFLETARIAVSRRDESLSEDQVSALREAFENGPTSQG
jgi:UDP-N-acetylglucosamine diphosphorylase/glucosamine-1-phosphate N-acetyltransferase